MFPTKAVSYHVTGRGEGSRLFLSTEHQCTPFVAATSVLCVLESSSKWPADVRAVSRVKAAFLAQLQRQLSEANSDLITVLHVHHLDVLRVAFYFCCCCTLCCSY